jgi:hypothetical protein
MTYVNDDEALRRWPRVPVEIGGALFSRASARVTVVDLSLGGCLVQCGVALDPDSIVDVQFAIAGRDVAVKGRVAHTSLDGAALPYAQRYLIGVEFMGLPVDEEGHLIKFLDGRSRELGLNV